MTSIEIVKRRDFLSGAAAAGLMAGACGAHKATAGGMTKPWEWIDKRAEEEDVAGTPLQFMPSMKDGSPLEDELTKYPNCPYCGMARGHEKWRHTRHLVHYLDESVDPTCSLHCTALSLGLNLDLVPKAIYGADTGSAREPPPLLEVEKLHYVIDPTKTGTMTRRSKWAYADLDKATEATGATGELADFDKALLAAYVDMAQDTIMIRKRRAEKRRTE